MLAARNPDGAGAEAVDVEADLAPPDLGNVLRAVRRGDDVALTWTEPAGSWLGTDVLTAGRRDQSDLAWQDRVPWSFPRAYTRYRVVAAPPALVQWRVRLLDTCGGTPGPP